MSRQLSPRAIRDSRMTALGLNPAAPLPIADPATVTSHLLALQGQNFLAAQWGLTVRGAVSDQTLCRSDLRAAFNAGQILRGWPLRGTLHLISAADIGWLQELTNTRALANLPRRRKELGLKPSTVQQAEDLVIAALISRGRLTRAEMYEHWEKNGIVLQKGWTSHLTRTFCQTGTIVFGPYGVNGRDLDLVLRDSWTNSDPDLKPASVPTTQPLFEKEVALTELAKGFLRGHGPATTADLSWWSGLNMGEVKRAFSQAEEVIEVSDGAKNYWALRDTLEVPPVPAETVQLLGAFDEHLLGYKDRSIQVDPKWAREVMTINGIARNTVVIAGKVVGIWKAKDLSVHYFEDDPAPSIQRQIDQELQRYQAFYAG